MNETQIANELDEFVATSDNYFDAVVPANCGECEGYHSVVEYGEKYLCVLCLDVSEALQRCEFCSDYSSGNMEQSYLSGCTACDGSSGWHKDD